MKLCEVLDEDDDSEWDRGGGCGGAGGGCGNTGGFGFVGLNTDCVQ